MGSAAVLRTWTAPALGLFLAAAAADARAVSVPSSHFVTLGPPNAPAHQVLVHPLEGRLYYALVRGERDGASVLYRSLDGGATWSIAQGGLPYLRPAGGARFVSSEVVVDPRYPGVAYLIELHGGRLLTPPRTFVHRTVDYGATWSDVHSGLDPLGIYGGVELYFPPSFPRTVWAKVSSVGIPRFWVSRDAGEDFFPEPDLVALPDSAFEPPPPLVRYAVDRSTNTIERSDDGGLTWRTTGATPYHPVSTTDVVGGAPDGRVYLGTSDLVSQFPPAGVFRSDDSGVSWRQVNTGLADLHVASLTAPQQIADSVAAATPGGLFVSTDGASTWRAPRAGLGKPVRAVARVSGNGSAGGVAALLAGDQRSLDGGATWSTISELATTDPDYAVEAGTEVVYALVPTESGGAAGALWRSDDGGASWRMLVGASCDAVAVQPAAAGALTALVAGSRTDSPLLAAAPLFCLESVGSPAELVLRRSLDRGEGFVELHSEAASTGLTPVSVVDLEIVTRANGAARVVLAANLGQGGVGGLGVAPLVRVSDDGGASWSDSTPGAGGQELSVQDVLLTAAGERILLATSAGVLASDDGGSSWDDVSRGLELAGPVQALASGLASGELYAGTAQSLYRSRNDGATWQRFDEGARGAFVHAIHAAGDAIYLATSHGVIARGGAVAGACTASDATLCLRGEEYRVEVAWAGLGAGSGQGHARPLTSDTGTFWFFEPTNVEIVIKVLDGCELNDHQWVFLTGLTDVETDVRVTRTADGTTRRYFRQQGEVFLPVLDLDAFPCE